MFEAGPLCYHLGLSAINENLAEFFGIRRVREADLVLADLLLMDTSVPFLHRDREFMVWGDRL